MAREFVRSQERKQRAQGGRKPDLPVLRCSFLCSAGRGLLPKRESGRPVRVDYFSLSTWPHFHQDVLLASVCSVSQVILGQFVTLCACFCF